MKGLLFRYLMALIAVTLTLSCAEEQDFDQFDDLEVTPTIASSILYVESEEDFINTVSSFGAFYSQVFNFDAFNEQFVAERLLEGVITYEIENTTSKPLNLTVEFLDEGGVPLAVDFFEIDPEPTPLVTREITYGPGGMRSLDVLQNTSSLRVTAENLGDATSTASTQDPKVILRSAGEFLFRLQ